MVGQRWDRHKAAKHTARREVFDLLPEHFHPELIDPREANVVIRARATGLSDDSGWPAWRPDVVSLEVG